MFYFHSEMSSVYPLSGRSLTFPQNIESAKPKECYMLPNLKIHPVVWLLLRGRLNCKRLELQQNLDMSQYKCFVFSGWEKGPTVLSAQLFWEFGEDKLSNEGGESVQAKVKGIKCQKPQRILKVLQFSLP